MKLAEIFDNVARQMQLDFDQARVALQHPSLKGGAFEEALRSVLRRYLPKKIDILQGIVVDAQGKSSRQLDVIISDAANTPVFYESGDTRVVPAETVYAVIEVKTNLDMKELEKCMENMASVRALAKSAYQPGAIAAPVAVYGSVFSAWPTNYYVFAIDSAPLEKLTSYLFEQYTAQKSPPHQRIDTICVLNRGVILNQDENGNVDALPSPGMRLGHITTKRPLLLFYALTARYWFQATIPPFNVLPYLQSMNFGEKEE